MPCPLEPSHRTPMSHLEKYFSILSKALFIAASESQNVILRCPSPVGPKATPGVVETLPSNKSLLQNESERHELRVDKTFPIGLDFAKRKALESTG